MIYRFDAFELDPARFELRKDGAAVAVEPQVLSLLLLLASNKDRLVSKDEIVEKIWNNRIVSEAAVASRVKSARQAVGDDGKRQRIVRTIHGKGFRFVSEVAFVRPAPPATAHAGDASGIGSGDAQVRPSIAVIPFRIIGEAGMHGYVSEALADELIADLARLHWLFVIARGSAFRFRGDAVDCREVGRALGVGYCLTGSLSFGGGGVTVTVELVDAGNGGVLWADSCSDSIDRLLDLQHEIASSLVAALERRIQLHEAQRARARGDERLDAWAAYHLGLDHMFRFNRTDNDAAGRMFERALDLSPEFARAHAGRSFTHFQTAFLNYRPDRAREGEAARSLAERAVVLDPLDPFCQLNMGRAFWLFGDLAESIEWLDRSIATSPNFAQGIYSRAWARTLSGQADEGKGDALLALRLSPLDPLRYAMLATCALAELIREDFEKAATLAERAARSPGSHKHIALIAAMATSLAGQTASARQWVRAARQKDPAVSARDFLQSFPFAPSAAREVIERTLKDLGL